jgi:hypothetical protein
MFINFLSTADVPGGTQETMQHENAWVLQRLLNLPCFGRAWVFQEFVFGQGSASFQLGDYQFRC